MKEAGYHKIAKKLAIAAIKQDPATLYNALLQRDLKKANYILEDDIPIEAINYIHPHNTFSALTQAVFDGEVGIIEN